MTAPAVTGITRAMSILIHADTKRGKTTFGATAPKPMLLVDAEMAHRFLAFAGWKMVHWDPMKESPPVPDGTWHICVVVVRTYAVMARTFDWLNSGQHQFRSVVIDSISEIQTRCKENEVTDGSGQMDQRKWGALLDHMDRLVRGFRDLTEHPTRPLEAVVLTSMTEMRDGKWRPYVQGQLRVKMPYFLDVIGYLYIDQVPGALPTDAPVSVRRMLVTPTAMIEAGERVQGRLPSVLDNPTVEGMLDAVFGPIALEGATQ